MTYQESIKVLKHHQEWRLGADIDMLEPKIITGAIDTILTLYDELYTKQEFLNAAEMGEVSMIDARHIVSLLDEARELNKKHTK
ncbi:MAG: hypothetical protein ACOVNU_04180 [Candidatus Kapaibacteriota bacterium]